MSAERIARELGGAQRGTQGWWQALCPCHRDSSPSFAVKDRSDGRGVLVKCFSGCKRDDLVAELRRRGLWPNGTREESSKAFGRGSKREEADIWQPVLPVPSYAPQPTFQHSRGRPSGVWNYNDADGRLLGYVGRFEKADAKKEFRSYICCRAPDGRLEWRWKGFPEPRPLYRLDRLVERQLDWTLVTEGEKSADAAADLFLDHVVITSPGGSNAAGKADWLPLRGRKVAVWPDVDAPGRRYAEDVAKLAREAGATKVVVVDVPDYFRKPDGSEGWDLADPPPAGWDVDRLRRLLDEAAFGKDAQLPEFSTLLDEAAELDSVAYDRRRVELAQQLGIRKGTLDAEVNKRRQERQEEKKPFLVEPPAWEQPVDGAALLDDIVAELRRYLIMPEHAPEAVALWILHAHALDAFQCSPLLALLSPERQCGKTTTLTVVQKLLPKALVSSSVSSASIYRVVEKYQPTLLIDELDTFIRDNEGLRGILDSGHYREAAFAMRVSGDELEPKLFSTWAPKVVAMIGRLPGTLSSRAVEVPLKRKRFDERVARFRMVRPAGLPELKRKCIRWAADNLISLRDAALDVSVPDGLNDRAADNWEPLLTIADRADGQWPERARKAALALSGNGVTEADSIGVMLLGDIKAIFERRALTVSSDLWVRIPSRELADALAAMEGRPWPEWKGKPITANAVARLLRDFKIAPKQLRCGSQNVSGYEQSAFTDAFARYLSPESPSTTPTSPTSLTSQPNSQHQSPTADFAVGVSGAETPIKISDVGSVEVKSPPPEGNGKDRDEGDEDGDADVPWEVTL